MRYDETVNQAYALIGKGQWLCCVVRLAMVECLEQGLDLVLEVTCWNLMECETVVIVPLPVPMSTEPGARNTVVMQPSRLSVQ